MANLIRLREVAALAGISIATARRWFKRGTVPPYRKTPTGHYLLFDPADVERWLQDMKVDPQADQGEGV